MQTLTHYSAAEYRLVHGLQSDSLSVRTKYSTRTLFSGEKKRELVAVVLENYF